MQLTELLYQRVKDLGAQGQIALQPGYVAVVSRAASLRSALVAALFPGPDDLRRLVDGEGPTRVGLGLVSGDGTPYRLLRELGGARQLQRFDAAGKKFSTLSQDNLEIESFLRVECGLPAADNYFSFFVLESNELPSSRARGAAGPDPVVDGAKVQASYGTGAAPTNGAAITGTQCGGRPQYIAATTAQKVPFSVHAS